MKLQREFSQKTLQKEIGVRADPRMVNRLAARLVGPNTTSSIHHPHHSVIDAEQHTSTDINTAVPPGSSAAASMWASIEGNKQQPMKETPGHRTGAAGVSIWEPKIHAKVGSVLLNLLMETALVSSEEGQIFPAFEHGYIALKGRKGQKNGATKKQGVMQLHPSVITLLEDSHTLRELIKPRYLPMVVPPLPWTKERVRLFDSGGAQGGYLKLQSQFMRTRGSFMQPDVLRRADLSQVFEALNFLGSVPWRINDRVLKVVEQVWAQGGGLAEIPRVNHHVIPDEPERTADITDEAYENMLNAHNNICRKLSAKNNDLRSLQADMCIKLRIAQDFRAEQQIYFPLNLGAYCILYILHTTG
jgi:DNA-directed RNA polymerase